MPTLGERFRAAREARGLSLSDVAEQIRIRSVYLAAIEDEKWSTIGAPVYIRGFLRTYARFLGLAPEEVVAEFNGSAPPEPASNGPALGSGYQPMPLPSRPLPILIWAASVVAVLLIAYVVYDALSPRQRTPVASIGSAAPAATADASVPPAAAATPPRHSEINAAAAVQPDDQQKSLELRFTAPSWVRVVVDGNVSMVGTFPAGTAKLFHGATAQLRVGNAGGVEIYIDGKRKGKLGATGDVAEREYTL
jgi:cytoskeleton protein RodZ